MYSYVLRCYPATEVVNNVAHSYCGTSNIQPYTPIKNNNIAMPKERDPTTYGPYRYPEAKNHSFVKNVENPPQIVESKSASHVSRRFKQTLVS
jgi:hypothetical protein